MIGSTNLEILINKLCVVQFSDIIVDNVPFLVLGHAGSHVYSGTGISIGAQDLGEHYNTRTYISHTSLRE